MSNYLNGFTKRTITQHKEEEIKTLKGSFGYICSKKHLWRI